MTKKYHGIIPPITTPIDENEKVDEASFRRLLEHSINVGMHGIFVAGSNGECMGLTQTERDRAIAIAIETCGDRVPLMAGVMDTSTMRVIENIKRLEQMGGKAAVITPEFYARHATPDETLRHYERISKSANIDLFIYNIPIFINHTLRADAIIKIAEFDHVVGYKDSSGIMLEFVKCLHHFKGTDFVLLQGITGLAGTSMLLGADGFVPSIGPVFPKPGLKIYEYGKKGDIERTMYWDKIYNECNSISFKAKNAGSGTKYLVSLLGLTDSRSTLPQEPLTEEEKKNMQHLFARMNETIAAAGE